MSYDFTLFYSCPSIMIQVQNTPLKALIAPSPIYRHPIPPTRHLILLKTQTRHETAAGPSPDPRDPLDPSVPYS